MKINTKATGIELTPSISEYIEKKLETLQKFFKNVDEILVNVEVGRNTKHHKSGDVFKAEIHVMANGEDYYASVDKDDLYAAIDEVKDEIVYELTSNRKKAQRLFRKGSIQIKSVIKGLVDFGDKNWKRFRNK